MKRTVLSSAVLLSLASCSEYEVVKHDAADVFYQLAAGEVDILLVVDNSCSMAPYQDKLATNFDNFLTYFTEGDVDYRIGVTTTSAQEVEFTPGSGCSQSEIDALPGPGELVGGTIITPDTEDGSAVFSDIVSVGTCGAGYEMGLEAARMALKNEQADLLRDSAYLSLIFVTDEEDSSPKTVNEYLNIYRGIKGQGERAAMYASGLVVNDIDECDQTQINSGATVGDRYIDVVKQADGVLGNICGDDFASIVTELSLNTSRLNDTFYLTDLPVPSSITVDIVPAGEDGYSPACDSGEWTYELKEENGESRPAIVFDRSHMPPPNSKVTVSYDRGGGDPAEFCAGEEG